MTEQTPTAVEQVDRDAASEIYDLLGFGPSQHVLDGAEDDAEVVQIVARHRLSATPTAPKADDIAEGLRALLTKANITLPLLYRPDGYDDWGVICSSDPTVYGGSKVVAASRGGDGDLDAHRRAGTDPYRPVGELIVAAVNALPQLLADRATASGEGPDEAAVERGAKSMWETDEHTPGHDTWSGLPEYGRDLWRDRARACLSASLPASQPVADVEKERDALKDEVATLEDRIIDLEQVPWPEWVTECLRIIRDESGYDGYDDHDGVDLPEELRETMNHLREEAEKATQEARADRELASHKSTADHYRAQADDYRAQVATLTAQRKFWHDAAAFGCEKADIAEAQAATLTSLPASQPVADVTKCRAAPDHADILETIESADPKWQTHGYTSALAEVRDMANVGRSLLEEIAGVTAYGPLKGWAPCDGPAEIVVDLHNMLTDALAQIATLTARVEALEGALRAVRDDLLDEHGHNALSIVDTVWHDAAETTVDFIDAALASDPACDGGE